MIKNIAIGLVCVCGFFFAMDIALTPYKIK